MISLRISIIISIRVLLSKPSISLLVFKANSLTFRSKSFLTLLTRKQVVFCEQYVVDWNASRAAREAGYSENTCGEIGYENLKKPQIKAYIEFLKTDTARLAGVSALKNIQELSKIAYSSIAHLHNTWIELKDFEALTDDQRSAIESIDTKVEKRTISVGEGKDIDTETHYVKIKMYSKTQAIDMINKMLGFNAPEKSEVKTTITGRKKIVFVKKRNE